MCLAHEPKNEDLITNSTALIRLGGKMGNRKTLFRKKN